MEQIYAYDLIIKSILNLKRDPVVEVQHTDKDCHFEWQVAQISPLPLKMAIFIGVLYLNHWVSFQIEYTFNN